MSHPTAAPFLIRPLVASLSLAFAAALAHAAPVAEVHALAQKEQQPLLDTLRDLVHIESGSKDIEGVRANGERTTWTIEAGKIGNDKPIVSVREVWTSPELMLTLSSHDFDPRTGESSYRLKNLKRGDRVLTSAGFYAEVDKVEDNGNVVLKLADRRKIDRLSTGVLPAPQAR